MESFPNHSVRVWRLVPEKSIHNPFSGDGAARYGGRWNNKGFPLLYASSSISLGMLETLANLRGIRSNPSYLAFPVDIPLNLTQVLSVGSLPKGWNAPANRHISQEIGVEWIRSCESLALRVPSVVNLHEFNYIINPNHPSFKNISLPPKKAAKKLSLDPRLIQKA